MNKETLQKFYPVIIGLGLLIPVVSIYFTFFAGSSGGGKSPVSDPNAPPSGSGSRGGFDVYPPKDGSTMLEGKSVPLQTLRDMAAAGGGDKKELANAINALGDAHDIYAVPQLLQLLDNKDEYIRGRAGVAIQKVLGDFHYAADLPETERKKIVEDMRQRWQRIMTKMGKAGEAKN